jgi:hypothetical protein
MDDMVRDLLIQIEVFGSGLTIVDKLDIFFWKLEYFRDTVQGFVVIDFTGNIF